MSALANRKFVKMNGLGNEIVIVDLRGAPEPIGAAEARAAARHEPYDQLMALYPGRGRTDAAIRIYNNDGSEAGACGNGMRCVAALIRRRDRKGGAEFRNTGRPRFLLARRRRALHGRHGHAALSLGRDSAGEGDARHARDRSCVRSARRADPAFALRREHGQSARHLLGRRIRPPTICAPSARCSNTIRCFPSAPTSRSPPSPSRDHVVIRTWERGAGLTKRLRLGGLRRCRRRGAARPHRPQSDGHVARRRPRHRMARGRRPRADDRPRRIRA